jgi:tetratricopeptide (TPR) repeat protein
MDKIDLEGFLIKNKLIIIGLFIAAVLIAGSIFGAKYYYYSLNKKASGMLWKGVRLYMSYDGKNPEVLSKSVSYFKKLRKKYHGTKAYKISDFYLGLDYMRIGKLKKASAYLGQYAAEYPKQNSNNLTYLAYSNIATIDMITKNYKGAIADFSQMSKIGNVKLQEYAMLEEAALYTQIKKPKKAVAIYNAMLTDDAMTKDRGYIENLIQLNS